MRVVCRAIHESCVVHWLAYDMRFTNPMSSFHMRARAPLTIDMTAEEARNRHALELGLRIWLTTILVYLS